ncbi:hypothetical protein AVEN_142118-1 [Araneus ventricosus]|uniref:Uncharacterized protein n=1 Tax=Araneus ventricosus TaxID=182803 RepID=A0A4Y2DHG3_ARAVE|nr:hypothetical protein AVEN_142118-1 [Araneus ventricosus]
MAFWVPSGSLPTLKKLKPFAYLEISIYVALQTETGPLFVGAEWKFGEWRDNSFVLDIGQHSKLRGLSYSDKLQHFGNIICCSTSKFSEAYKRFQNLSLKGGIDWVPIIIINKAIPFSYLWIYHINISSGLLSNPRFISSKDFRGSRNEILA